MQKAEAEAEAEKRTTRRRLVGLPAECELGGLVANGLVRDITQAGAFVASNRERKPGGIQVSSTSPLDRLLGVGDQFLLTFVKTTVMNERSVLATVCWQGISAEHGCHGYGVQYNTERRFEVAAQPTSKKSVAPREIAL